MSSSTIPNAETDSHQRRARFFRRVFALLLVLFVGLGAAGVLGVRHREVTAASDGYELTVTYGTVTRPGLATLWEVEVTKDGGFDGPITLATSSHYFGAFDENGLDPEPTSAVGEGDTIVWEFDPPEGDRFSLGYDARIEPAQQWAAFTARTAVLDEAGDVIVAVEYRTVVLP